AFQKESDGMIRVRLLKSASLRDGRIGVAAVKRIERAARFGRDGKSLRAHGGSEHREENGSGNRQKNGMGTFANHFTLLSQPASQAAVTYITKHSSAKGMNPK